MLTILLNPKNPEPLYRQICSGIQNEIAAGNLKPQEKLPSRRALAAHLQTSIMTVQTAYEQLVAEGYLYTKPRAGYYVDPDAALLFHGETDEPPPDLHAAPPNPGQPADWIDFSTAGVDLDQFPFSTWASLSRQVLTSKQETLLQATPSMGLYDLRAAIADHLRAFRDIHAVPEQILIGAGTEYLLGMLVQLLGASRRYAAEEPGYPKGKQILRSNGASVVPVPMDADGLDPERLLRSGASVALVTPSHQFPTGKVMPLRRRARLLEWTSQAPDRWLIEDDYDTELRFHGKPLPALFSLDRNAHVIYLNTFARTLAPSLRIGYVVLPPTLAKRFQKEFSFYSCSVPSFEQYTLVQFLKKGCLERHLHRMKRTYQERQTLLTQQLRSHPFATHLTILGEEAGLHLLLQVDLPCTESTLVHEAENAHVSVYALSAYCEIPNQKSKRLPCIVMGYACLSPDEIKAGTKRLLDAWQRLSETLT